MGEVCLYVAMHDATFMSGKLSNCTTGGDVGVLQAMLGAGITGRKSGEGFYNYNAKGSDKPVNPAVMGIVKKFTKEGSPSAGLGGDTAAKRMTSRLIIEALLCLQDGIVRNPGDGDMGAIFGMGFSPYRGGPLRYLDIYGAQKVTDLLRG